MRLHRLQPSPGARRVPKRVGRGPGSGHGSTAGRGDKGQKARGPAPRAGFEGGQMPLQRRVPKRGFRSMKRDRVEVVNLRDLERWTDREVFDPSVFLELGLIKGKDRKVKVLAQGELSRKLRVVAHAFSRAAREKIERRGGQVEVLP